MDEGFEIYFWNLTEETQQELLDYFRVDDPAEMNWDTFPVTSVYGAED